MRASENGHVDVVEYLINHGANINAADNVIDAIYVTYAVIFIILISIYNLFHTYCIELIFFIYFTSSDSSVTYYIM